MKGSWLLLAAAGTLVAACTDEPTTLARSPQPSPAPAPPAFAIAVGSGPTGAIFTTMPDGGVVNANVQYKQKIEVYLDGGPGPHAPVTAAGLDDGDYVFQITDPSGQYLLSQDVAACRLVRVNGGVMVRLRDLVGTNADGSPQLADHDPANDDACHKSDNAPHPTNPGVAGVSGRHDTNVDTDHGAQGAIVIQMMPFSNTPNPGGVYKAWVSTLGAYLAKGGVLTKQQKTQNGRAAQPCSETCYVPDPGFGPPRNLQKTDNFKVLGVPPRITVDKYTDVNGNGVFDAADTKLDGWPISITETLADGSIVPIQGPLFTPVDVSVAPGSTVKVCEAARSGWKYEYALVNGSPVAATLDANGAYCTGDIAVSAGTTSIAVAFGNFELGAKSGTKFHDHNANGTRDGGDEALDGVPVDLLSSSLAVLQSTSTAGGGKYAFTGLDVGTYTVCEKLTSGWAQSAAVAGDASESVVSCPAGYAANGIRFAITTSGQRLTGNDFGNFQPVRVSGTKFIDLNGDGVRQGGEGCPSETANTPGCAGVTVHLDGTANPGGTAVHLTTQTAANGDYSFSNIAPGSYTITIDEPAGFSCTFPSSTSTCNYARTITSGTASTGNDFGDVAPASVSGLKLSDVNGNGLQDGGEVGIPNWTVYLFGTDGLGRAVDRVTTTDGSGRFTFGSVWPGAYHLCELQLAGYIQRFPTLGTPNAVDCATLPHAPALSGIGYNLTLQSADAVTAGFDFRNQPAQGCTPGFWQGGFGIDLWNTVNDPQWGPPRITNGSANPFIQATYFNTFFDPASELALNVATGNPWTMLDIVGTGGTSVNAQKTARDVVAAYLNRSAGIAFPYDLSQITSDWFKANRGLVTGDREADLLALHTKLDAANNLHNTPLCQ